MDAPAFFSLCASLVSHLANIANNDFNVFVSLTQDVIDLNNTFCQSNPSYPSQNHRSRGQGGQGSQPQAQNHNLSQQQQGFSSQQP